MPVAVMKNPKMKAFEERSIRRTAIDTKSDPRHAMNAESTRPKKPNKPKMMYGGMGKKKKMMGGSMSKKRPEMMKGGMANGKKHMYRAGGSVMENLTPGQQRMVQAMARDNKKA